MRGKKFLQLHVLPFFIAALAALSVFLFPYRTQRNFLQLDHDMRLKVSRIPTLADMYPNCSDDQLTEKKLRTYLLNGDLVVMGSSEMTNSALTAIPYNFFNAHKIPCFGVGHEGNQLLCITAQLAAYHNELAGAKLTLILSPGWFEGRSAHGTPLKAFLEYADEHLLYYLFYDDSIPKQIRDHIFDYIVDHYKDIDSPSSILSEIYYSRSAERNKLLLPFYVPFAAMHHQYTVRKRKIMSDPGISDKPFTIRELSSNGRRDTLRACVVNWDSLHDDAIKKFQPLCTNNPYGIENNYYDKWMRGNGLKQLDIPGENANQELNDLYVLLGLLKQYKCRPLFVLQPMNALVVSNIKELDPVLDKVRQAIKQNGFELLDLHTSDPEKYVKGTLTDFQHMGEAAWYKVDQKMSEYFLQNK
jgi:D-alanyl-lipoteichoic acid biosynthesis protein DltD